MIIRVDMDIVDRVPEKYTSRGYTQFKIDVQDFLQNELGLKINSIHEESVGWWDYHYVIDLEYNPKVSFFMLKYSNYLVVVDS